MSDERKIVLGPLFTVGVMLGLYGLLRRRRRPLVLAVVALAADRTAVGRRLASFLNSTS